MAAQKAASKNTEEKIEEDMGQAPSLSDAAYLLLCRSTSSSVAAKYNRTVLSSLADARVLPSGLKVTDTTELVWPKRVASSWRVATSHSFTALSQFPPEA